MDPLEITFELRRHQSNQSKIARRRGVSPSMVNLVVHGRAKARHIHQEIARTIRRPVEEIWPQFYQKAS
jgi:lambda repressor-like predicted transcriptional regulator